MTYLMDITFFEVAMALLFVGTTERILLAYAPIEMVGRNGWLMRGEVEE